MNWLKTERLNAIYAVTVAEFPIPRGESVVSGKIEMGNYTLLYTAK